MTSISLGSIFIRPSIVEVMREEYAPISTIGAFFFGSLIPIYKNSRAFL